MLTICLVVGTILTKNNIVFCLSSFSNLDPDSSQDHDIEANKEKGVLASIAASMGWGFPQVKLASWNPENEEQWTVSLLFQIIWLGSAIFG